MSFDLFNLTITITLRWGIGLDLESTGGDVPTLVIDTDGTATPCLYNGWTIRIPFIMLTLGIIR
jgi:hypothetical protein